MGSMETRKRKEIIAINDYFVEPHEKLVLDGYKHWEVCRNVEANVVRCLFGCRKYS